MQINERQEEFKLLIKERLKPDRYVHSVNVAKSAAYLAEKYGADKQKAYAAGLLHDVMKNASDFEQLSVIAKAGFEMTDCEKVNKKLWHSISGAAFVKAELGITDEDFVNSVRYHTTARRGMSLLEKIIYIADYISAERDYPDVDVMRALADKSLEEAMLYSLKYTISTLVGKNLVLHPDSVDAYNEIIMKEVFS